MKKIDIIPWHKRLLFLLLRKCPNCGAKITQSRYSFLDMKFRYKCDNCGAEYV